jgi:hypothetical protein
MDDNETHVWTPQEIARHNPFGSDATCIVVDDRQLNINQLTDEISALTGETVQLVQLRIPQEDDRRLWMYVCPPIETQIVEKCIDDHIPDPDYGLPPEVLQRERLRKKLDEGVSLTQDEVLLALRLSLTKF